MGQVRGIATVTAMPEGSPPGSAGDAVAEVARWLEPKLGAALVRLPRSLRAGIEEIRLRAGRPVQLVTADGDLFLDADGKPVRDPRGAPPVDGSLVDKTWQIVCEASVYSHEREARQGYLTLPGGHRVGLAGRVLADGGRIERLRDVASLNFRVARERPGCADPVLGALWNRTVGLPHHCLIASPPGAGKTTLLRDLVRQLSWGVVGLGIPGLRVTVVDERSEIAACVRGVPSRDLGPRTDVLDGCPKAAGIQMAVRSLGPQLIACDELGGAEDARAVLEAAHAGVRVLATAHARHADDLYRRPSLESLLRAGLFTRVVVLSRDPRPGTVRYAGPPRFPGTDPVAAAGTFDGLPGRPAAGGIVPGSREGRCS